MEKRKNPTWSDSKLMSVPDACGYYALGKHSIMNVATEAGAVCKVGKRVLLDRQRMDAYFDSLLES